MFRNISASRVTSGTSTLPYLLRHHHRDRWCRQSVSLAEASGTDVTLTPSPGVANGDTVTVTYTASD